LEQAGGQLPALRQNAVLCQYMFCIKHHASQHMYESKWGNSKLCSTVAVPACVYTLSPSPHF
jgi:hypothetical protein